jgi:1,4-dihydroxy-2-naphthoate octaprenyltransferase
MLRRRPRRTAPSRVRHPAAALLFLAALYLTATVVNVLLALTMNAWWPALFASLLALVTVLCATAAWRRL